MRWGSWLSFVNYVFEIQDYLITFINNFYEYNDPHTMKITIKKLLSLLRDHNQLINLKLNIALLSEVNLPYIFLSNFLESSSHPQVF
jgi:hypothetical protein